MTLNAARRLDRSNLLRAREVDTNDKPSPTKPVKVVKPAPSPTPDTSSNGSTSSSRTRRSDLDLRSNLLRQQVDANVRSSDDNKGAVGVAVAKGTFTERVNARFGDWDKDKDGYLSRTEIDTAMLDKTNAGDDAAALATLKDRVDELEELSDDEYGDENDGVTKNDLGEYEKNAKAGRTDQDTENRYGWFKYKIDRQSMDLFASGTPDWKSVEQGRVGDCAYLAAIVAKTKNDPEAIKKMIKDNGDGTYEVTLPGKKPVTVTRPTEAELAYYGTAGKDGLWLSVLEKAVGQSQGRGNLLWNTKLPQDELDGAIGWRGINPITSRSTDGDLLVATTKNRTRTRLDDAFKNNRIVTAGIRNQIGSGETPLPMGHAYSVVGWDRKTDTITLRNPWGRGELKDANGKPRDGKDDGVFTMTMDEFYKHFSMINYEN
ncbi:C2 family cysteine protease [Myxococcota bacterium]|nr:C2 family cysteine protease [Myxococcota bacterium]